MMEMEHLSGGYRGGLVLFDLSLEVRAGEIVALIGPNGAGKTSTLRAISRTLPTTRGTIRFGGRDLAPMSGAAVVALGIAHVPEGRRVFPRLSVYENLMLGAFVLRDRRRAERELERVSGMFPVLKGRMAQLAGTLSGGEQQMLALGRGLMSDPKLMLLDEPSLGLSPQMTADVFAMIEALRSDGRAILLVEQNAVLALATADRGYVLGGGRILAAGRSHELLETERLKQSYLGYGSNPNEEETVHGP
jgi:branched-chain amino acid transport system ATP-binding protein